jgi:hypothetical protein
LEVFHRLLFRRPARQFYLRAGRYFLSEPNQFVPIAAHAQGFHVFELVQSASRLNAFHHIVPLQFGLRINQIDGSLVDGQNIL